jgi:hypothetical protein
MRGDWRSTTWQKGMSSPNPGGRPKALHDVQELARQHTEAAINALAKIMNDDEARHSARISAAEALLSRGWGRPIQPTVQARRRSNSGLMNSTVRLAKPSTRRLPTRVSVSRSGNPTGWAEAIVG